MHAIVAQHHFQINQERRDLGRKAAKGLRKRHTGAHPFCPKTQRLLALAMLWSKVVYYRTNKSIGSRQMRRLMKQHGITDAFQITLEEARQRRIAIRKQLQELQKTSEQLRKNWIRQFMKRSTLFFLVSALLMMFVIVACGTSADEGPQIVRVVETAEVPVTVIVERVADGSEAASESAVVEQSAEQGISL